jgi:pimeloyl-ACP methyl ester carboxylesterase
MLTLIHGLGGSPAEMQPLADRLAAFGPVALPTLLSHGGRPLAEKGGYDALFEDLLQQLGEEPTFLLGYSFGGYLAVHLAARFPDRVRAAVAIGTRFRYDAPAIDYLRHLFTPDRLFGAGEARRPVLEQRFGAEMAQASLARGLALFERLSADPPVPDEAMRAIPRPVFLISGREDQIAPAAETGRAAALLATGRVGLFRGPSHPIDRLPLDKVAAAISGFLADVRAGTFRPGLAIDLGEGLVTGGMPASDIRARFRPRSG